MEVTFKLMFYGMYNVKPCHSLPALPPHRKFETRPSSAATEPTLQSAGNSVPRSRISRSSSRCATGPVTTWAAAMPEPATAGTPMPGQHESPQQSSPSTC